MQISFRRTGGFAPIPMSCEIDTSCAPDGAQIEALVTASDFWQLENPKRSGAFDVHKYHLTIESGEKSNSISFDQLSVPVGLRPLFELLKAKLSPMPD